MIKMLRTLSVAAVAAVTILGIPASAETLGEMLRDSGWDRILGTWVDEDSGGERVATTYKWRFKDRVIEVSTETQNMNSVGLIAVSAESGEVVHAGADDRGGTALGTWSEDDGDAVLDLEFSSAEGDTGTMRVRHHLENDDRMTVTIEVAGEEMTFTMVRKK